MSLARWTGTTAVMCAVASLLSALTPPLDQLRQAATSPQALVDSAGADTLLTALASGGAWLCWTWGTLGLLLTGFTALPGPAGRGAGFVLRAVLPAGARRLAAVAVGMSLATVAPALIGPVAGPPTAAAGFAPAAATAPAATPRPVDWPSAESPGIPPDWPGAPAPAPAPGAEPAPGPASAPVPPEGTVAEHVVLRGDCLWDIAAGWLTRQRPGTPVSDADIVAAVHTWWQANAQVIGPDPDLLLPGQVLRAPS